LQHLFYFIAHVQTAFPVQIESKRRKLDRSKSWRRRSHLFLPVPTRPFYFPRFLCFLTQIFLLPPVSALAPGWNWISFIFSVAKLRWVRV